MSSRDYAEALASRLKRLDEGWKKEAQELQREVLRLRQELLMSRAAARVAGSGEAAGGNADKVDSFHSPQRVLAASLHRLSWSFSRGSDIHSRA